MAGCTYLPGQKNIVTYFGITSKPDLGTEYNILAQTAIVPYLNEIIYLGASTNPRNSESSSIDTTVGTNPYFVLDYDPAYVIDLIMLAFDLEIAETIHTDNSTSMEKYSVTDLGLLIDGYIGIDPTVLTYTDLLTNNRISSDNRLVTDSHTPTDNDIGAYIDLLTEKDIFSNHCCRVNSPLFSLFLQFQPSRYHIIQGEIGPGTKKEVGFRQKIDIEIYRNNDQPGI